MELFKDTNYDFLKWRFHAIAISLAFIAAGAVFFFTRGANLGVDFAGGAELVLRFQDEVPVDQLRGVLGDATIQQYGPTTDNSVIIRLPKQTTEGDYAGQAVNRIARELNGDNADRVDLNLHGRDRIAGLLLDADPDGRGTGDPAAAHYSTVAGNVIARRSELGIFSSMDQLASAEGVSPKAAATLSSQATLGRFNILNQETVGPQVGRELQNKAILAVLLSTLAMGIYIAFRFDFKFGVAAVVCLIHDVAIALAFLLMMNGEFEILTIASFLMIIGYSINDTVVVYDRVRENRRKAVKESFYQVMNRSLNQTLSRTILTGGSVILVLISLILFGGEVINEFAWLLLIGTIAGTFSTMFVAPAVALLWNDGASATVREARAEKRVDSGRRARA